MPDRLIDSALGLGGATGVLVAVLIAFIVAVLFFLRTAYKDYVTSLRQIREEANEKEVRHEEKFAELMAAEREARAAHIKDLAELVSRNTAAFEALRAELAAHRQSR